MSAGSASDLLIYQESQQSEMPLRRFSRTNLKTGLCGGDTWLDNFNQTWQHRIAGSQLGNDWGSKSRAMSGPIHTAENARVRSMRRALGQAPAFAIWQAPASQHVLQRKSGHCPCGGGCPACQEKVSGLTISQPTDPAEIEADQIADKVMRMSVDGAPPKTNVSHTPNSIHRKCDACETGEEEFTKTSVMRKEAFASAAPSPPPADTSPSIKSVINSGGRPLDRETRNFFEPRFGADLNHVRVHTDTSAAQTARSITARAFTLGSHIVFGSGEYQPDSESGKQLLAHELAHIRQAGNATLNRQTIYRQPDLECGGGWYSRDHPMPARTWLRCLRQGKIAEDQEQFLRHTETGEIFGKQRLIEWAISQGDTPENVLRRIYSSHEFSGNAEAREGAVIELALALRETSIAERRERRDERIRMEREVERQRDEARKQERLQAEAKRKRARWLAGEGDPHADILEKPKPDPSQDRAGVVTFQTYDDSGELKIIKFENAEEYGAWVESRLGDIKLRCQILHSNFFLYLRLDRQNVDETWNYAAWYQKPGLTIANPGISKVAIAYGIQGLRFCKRALETSDAAAQFIKNGRGTPAGIQLNEAMRLQLRAEHAFNTMGVRHEGDNALDLGRLQDVSTTGDVATNFIPGAGQLVVRVAKNAAVRGSTMHSDPDAKFGVTGFLWQTAGDVAGYKVQSVIAGPDAGFVRTTVGGIASNQVSNAVAAHDPTKLFEFDPLATGLTVLGAGVHSYFRQRQDVSAPPVPDERSTVPQATTALPPGATDIPSTPPAHRPDTVPAPTGGEGKDFQDELRPMVPQDKVAFDQTGIRPDTSADDSLQKPAQDVTELEVKSSVTDETIDGRGLADDGYRTMAGIGRPPADGGLPPSKTVPTAVSPISTTPPPLANVASGEIVSPDAPALGPSVPGPNQPKVYVRFQPETFETQDAAAIDALKLSNPQSIAAGREFAGQTFQTQEGLWGYSGPVMISEEQSISKGRIDSKPQDAAVHPDWGIATGDFHTHGSYQSVLEGHLMENPHWKPGNFRLQQTPREPDTMLWQHTGILKIRMLPDEFSFADIQHLNEMARKAGVRWTSYVGTPSGKFRMMYSIPGYGPSMPVVIYLPGR